MTRTIVNELGTITISEDVIATIAGLAAVESYGLVGMSSRKLTDGIVELLGRESLGKGVEIGEENGQLHIDVHIIVSYGIKISEVAQNVINQVRYAVETMTGLKVARVNVNVRGVKLTARK
ncbi:MAG: Asp23/Gls24 family envelope stress response protein [Firmicutes bacterium]|nr:Asp23/Gls24 family envelope stress response protein [Bacillota bacterium]